MGDLMHDIFVDLHAVSGLDQRTKGKAQFVLRGSNFMVMLIAGQAHFQHGGDHLAADVNGAVYGRDREITALGARTVAEVTGFIGAASVGRQFDIVDAEARSIITIVKGDIVEHEEFSFRADIDGITNARCFQMGFGAFCG
jgi:hypothetical protein